MYTPEQETAFEVLRNNINKFTELHVAKLPEQMVETNYMAFCTSCIYKEHLPKENWWHWNQSNSKIERFFNNTRVVLQKFNTRKKNPSQEDRKISYKLWLYSIYNMDGQYIASFIWCERGIEKVNPTNLQLDHLSFLQEFMEENVASDFGWNFQQAQNQQQIPQYNMNIPTPNFVNQQVNFVNQPQPFVNQPLPNSTFVNQSSGNVNQSASFVNYQIPYFVNSPNPSVNQQNTNININPNYHYYYHYPSPVPGNPNAQFPNNNNNNNNNNNANDVNNNLKKQF